MGKPAEREQIVFYSSCFCAFMYPDLIQSLILIQTRSHISTMYNLPQIIFLAYSFEAESWAFFPRLPKLNHRMNRVKQSEILGALAEDTV